MDNSQRTGQYNQRFESRINQTPEEKVEELRKRIKNYFGQTYVKSILNLDEGNYIFIIDKTSDFVQKELKGVTSSQLRNLFNHVKNNEDNTIGLFKLKPLLAYAVGREKKGKMDMFAMLTEDLLSGINNENKKNFVEFFEAIVAYHKRFHGGD